MKDQSLMWRISVIPLLVALVTACNQEQTPATTAMPAASEHSASLLLASWNDVPSRQSITAFVEKVTTPGSPDFVPAEKRIAVFDNDGTLWSEQPLYFQAMFVFDRIKALAPAHPEWQGQEPFASVLKGDVQGALAGGIPALLQMMAGTHAGMGSDEFDHIASEWLASARHPQHDRLYTSMVFQPMLELIDYLEANDIKVFIVSGGGAAFLRAFAAEVYGVPPERVIGSTIKSEFSQVESVPTVMRLPAVDFIDDKEGKPVGIYNGIGVRPLMAFGNSDGDLQMLQWTMAGEGPRFAALLHHTDGEREYAYDRESHVGHLDKALDQASRDGWTVIDMAADWAEVWPSVSAPE